MSKKYSDIMEHDGKHFRYNYERAVLEFLSLTEEEFDADDNLIVIPLDEPEVIDATGLSKENWEKDAEYWMSEYSYEIDEECAYLSKFI